MEATGRRHAPSRVLRAERGIRCSERFDVDRERGGQREERDCPFADSPGDTASSRACEARADWLQATSV